MSDPDELFNQALRAIELDRRGVAIDRLQRVIAADPTDCEAAVLLVDQLREAGELDAAEAHLERLVQAAPDEPHYLVLRADVRLERDDPRGAALLLRRALDLAPGDWQALYLLGTAFSMVGAWAEATKAYRLSLESNPFEADTWYDLAVASERAGLAADERAGAWQGYLRVAPGAEDREEIEQIIAGLRGQV